MSYAEHLSERAGKYGRYQYTILVPPTVARRGEIELLAEHIDITEGGTLRAVGKDGRLLLALTRGTWDGVYASSCLDGGPVSVLAWDGHICSENDPHPVNWAELHHGDLA